MPGSDRADVCEPDDRRDWKDFLSDTPLAEALLLEQRLGAALGSSEGTDAPAVSARTFYRVIGEIGRGGMGVVLEVEDPKLRTRVAMKVLREDIDQVPSGVTRIRMMTRFLREASITKDLNHPGVVPVHDLGLLESGTPFFTMPLIRGRGLGDVLRWARLGVREWNVQRAVQILIHVCQTVSHAHDMGVIHRDLKPANILVVGSLGQAYVLDWGLAKVIGEGNPLAEDEGKLKVDWVRARTRVVHGPGSPILGRPNGTRMDSVMGTAGYMSPEQAAGRNHAVDQRSDIYSMGAILYELLSGRAPYPCTALGNSLPAVQRRILRGPPHPIRRLAKRRHSGLCRICERAMSRAIEDRYASIQEMVEDLQRSLIEQMTPHGLPLRSPTVFAAAFVSLATGLMLGINLGRPPEARAADKQSSVNRAPTPLRSSVNGDGAPLVLVDAAHGQESR